MVKIPPGCITIDRWENVGESGTKWCHTFKGIDPRFNSVYNTSFFGFLGIPGGVF